MNNITFIIGNGFDLELGLQTKFSSFIEWYKEQPCTNETVTKIKEEILNDPDNTEDMWWSDTEMAMGKSFAKYEKNYKNYLSFLTDFKKHLIAYLSDEEKKCSYNSIDNIASTFINFLFNFEEEIVGGIDESIYSHSNFSYYTQDAVNNFSFINFNYTNTLTNIIHTIQNRHDFAFNNNTLGTINDCLHINGSVDGRALLISGVNEDDQISTRNIEINDTIRTSLVKKYMYKKGNQVLVEEAKNLIATSNTLCILGFSMGDSDKMWRDIIATWLIEPEHRIIVFGSQSLGPDLKLLEERTPYLENMKNNLFKKLSQDNTYLYESAKERMYFIDHTNLLRFDILKNKDLTSKLHLE